MPIRPRTAALGAGLCVALLALVRFAAFHVGFFEHADQATYMQFGNLGAHTPVGWLAGHLVSKFDPDPYVYLVVAVIAVALVRGRPWLALAAAAIVLGSNVTTELLKHLLASPRPGWLFPSGYSPLPPDSWPSGHSTAAMSLVLSAVLVSPGRLRPAVAALGGALAVGVGYSVLATGMHYPSDVLGGYLVAATWGLGTVAGLLAADGWRLGSRRTSVESVSIWAALGAPGAVLLAAFVLCAGLLISRPDDVVSYARAHEAFVFGAVGIAALGLSVSTGMLLSVRR
jgi:membrane-associated phospholipid phosphatase